MRSGLLRNIILVLLVMTAGMMLGSAPAFADQMITAGDLSLGIAGEEEFLAGYVLVPRLPVFWESDTPWTLSVSSLDPDLGVSNDASFVKPLGDLLWRLSDEEVWRPMSQDPQELTWSFEMGAGVIYIDVLVRLDWLSDAPGIYRADIVFSMAPL